MIEHRRFDRQGGDADILVSPPASPYGVFLPGEIAVQIKWIQGVDENDEYAVLQIVQWAESQGSDAVNCVIRLSVWIHRGGAKARRGKRRHVNRWFANDVLPSR